MFVNTSTCRNRYAAVSVITTEPVDTLLQKQQKLEVKVMDNGSVTVNTITRHLCNYLYQCNIKPIPVTVRSVAVRLLGSRVRILLGACICLLCLLCVEHR